MAFRRDSRRALVLEAMLAIVDCDAEDDEAYHRAWCRFWAAVRSAGWEPRIQIATAKDGAERVVE